VDVRQIAAELGVRCVLEGGVRKSSSRLRITGQIDAMTGAHLWADSLDVGLEDVFDLQDKITANVVGAIEPTMRKAEIERARRKSVENLDAYDLYLRALPHVYAMGPEENLLGNDLLTKAIALEATDANNRQSKAFANILVDFPSRFWFFRPSRNGRDLPTTAI
jgi:adenylate cyclase